MWKSFSNGGFHPSKLFFLSGMIGKSYVHVEGHTGGPYQLSTHTHTHTHTYTHTHTHTHTNTHTHAKIYNHEDLNQALVQ